MEFSLGVAQTTGHTVHSCCFPVCFQGKLEGIRGDCSLHITRWKNQCQSYRAAGSHTAALIRSYTDFKNSPPFQTNFLECKNRIWSGSLFYPPKIQYTTPNQHVEQPHIVPADSHSRFCNADDLPSSPLVLKQNVSNFTCWGLGEHPQSGNEPDSSEFPLTELSATASGLHQHHSAKKKTLKSKNCFSRSACP